MRLTLITLILLLSTATTWSQEEPVTRQRQRRNRVQPPPTEQTAPAQTAPDQAGTKTESAARPFIDADGDGIDDRPASAAAQDGTGGKGLRTRQRDRFIDLDGDGINDNRCSGLGIRKKQRGRQSGGQAR